MNLRYASTLSMILVLVLGLIYSASLQTAKADGDYAEAIVGTKTYKFDWDYEREGQDVGKNSHSKQVTVSAKSGSVIGVKVFAGDYGGLLISVTKDKIKATSHKITFGKLHDATHVGGCYDVACLQEWQLPSVKKGTYSLLFDTSGEEVEEYFITKIKISK